MNERCTLSPLDSDLGVIVVDLFRRRKLDLLDSHDAFDLHEAYVAGGRTVLDDLAF